MVLLEPPSLIWAVLPLKQAVQNNLSQWISLSHTNGCFKCAVFTASNIHLCKHTCCLFYVCLCLSLVYKSNYVAFPGNYLQQIYVRANVMLEFWNLNEFLSSLHRFNVSTIVRVFWVRVVWDFEMGHCKYSSTSFCPSVRL